MAEPAKLGCLGYGDRQSAWGLRFSFYAPADGVRGQETRL